MSQWWLTASCVPFWISARILACQCKQETNIGSPRPDIRYCEAIYSKYSVSAHRVAKTAPAMTDSKHTIFSLMPDECFFQGIDEKGRLEFRTQISLNAPKSAFVSERYLAAVAMTEICRKYGKGKVLGAPPLAPHAVNSMCTHRSSIRRCQEAFNLPLVSLSTSEFKRLSRKYMDDSQNWYIALLCGVQPTDSCGIT